jgi:Undecaprenyl-phosphate glucose phosphotransferase
MSESPEWGALSLEDIRRAEAARPARNAEELSAEAQAAAQALAGPRLDAARFVAAIAAADAFVIGVAVYVAIAGSGAARGASGAVAVAGPAASALAALAVVAALFLMQAYRPRSLARFPAGAARAGGLGAVVAALSPALAGAGAAHALLAGLVAGMMLVALRSVQAGFFGWALESGALDRRAVLVGGGGNAEKLIAGLAARPDNDIRIVAMFDDRGDDRSPSLVAGVRKLGTIAEIVDFARIAHIDMLIVTLPLSAEKRILSLLRQLWVLPLDVRLSAYSGDFAFDGDRALIGVRDRPLAAWRRGAKRALDVVGASAALIALSPVLLATALAIRLDSPGPVFFRQLRHGYNDQRIAVMKFRSMRTETCDPEARSIVVQGDPRVTRVGRFIRKTSIDELPQLFNVLRGELSLVGPRPHALTAKSSREELFAEIVDGYSGRHRVPPGVTGWAQVNGWRGEVSDPAMLRQRFEHDLYYIENWSIWLDLKILLRTPLALLDTRHAY